MNDPEKVLCAHRLVADASPLRAHILDRARRAPLPERVGRPGRALAAALVALAVTVALATWAARSPRIPSRADVHRAHATRLASDLGDPTLEPRVRLALTGRRHLPGPWRAAPIDPR